MCNQTSTSNGPPFAGSIKHELDFPMPCEVQYEQMSDDIYLFCIIDHK